MREKKNIGNLRWFFMSKYKKLLEQIRCAQNNHQRLHLENGVVLDFVPGSDYDFPESELPREGSKNCWDRFSSSVDQVIYLEVYDCFAGDVKVLAVGSDRIFIEIVEASACYGCQIYPLPGEKYWVAEWLLPPKDECNDENWAIPSGSTASEFQEEDLPF